MIYILEVSCQDVCLVSLVIDIRLHTLTFMFLTTSGTPFLSSGTAHAYLLKISITHDKNLIPLKNLLVNCISARSAPLYIVSK